MEIEIRKSSFAAIAIKLLQGVIYAEDKKTWNELLGWQSAVREYFGKIGMELIINETDGFARIKQPPSDETDDNPLPRLMGKQALSYEATLLAVILREGLEEFDIRNEGTKYYLTQKEIKEKIELFFKEQTNQSKLWKDLSKPIDSLQKVGILKMNREDSLNRDNSQYEIKRIIKAFISNETLEIIKNKLASYVNTL